jgi:hypothetical protein
MIDSSFSANITLSFYLSYLSEFWGAAHIVFFKEAALLLKVGFLWFLTVIAQNVDSPVPRVAVVWFAVAEAGSVHTTGYLLFNPQEGFLR